MKEAIHQLKKQLPYLPRTMKLVWRAARWWSLGWALLLLLQGALPALTISLTRLLVDGLVAALESGGGWAALQPVIGLLALMVTLLLLNDILRSIASWVRTAQSERVQDHIHGLIHDKALALDLGFFESPEYYDQLHRARVDAINRPIALLENIGTLVQNGITLAAMLVILLPYGWWLPLLLLVGTFPALVVVLRFTVEFHRWRLRTTADVRRTRYFDWLITQRETAAELRLFALGPHFRTSFQQLRRKLRGERVDLARRQVFAELFAALFGLLALGGALFWMLQQALAGAVSLGDLALFYQAFNQGQKLMRTLLTNVGEVYKNIVFLDNLFEFLAITPKILEPDEPLPLPETAVPDIRFQNVTFAYPHSKRPALDGFSLHIPAGKITAIVGNNGAGKSTLIKLLCRFYDPQQGKVLFNGSDLARFSPTELHRLITVLFQEPVHYHDTAAQNIALGDLHAAPDQNAVETAARAAGAEAPIRRLPDGYETLLGRWFGGTELSVGEWQRVALARAFLRRAQIVVLDEPTSAMDSWAEADWLSRFRTLTAERTALIITHRFTTAMQADVIHVMVDGRVVESGSHAELMALDGRYAQSWRQQMRQAASLS